MSNSTELLKILTQPATSPRETGWHVIDQLHRTVFESANKGVAESYVVTHSLPGNQLKIVDFTHTSKF